MFLFEMGKSYQEGLGEFRGKMIDICWFAVGLFKDQLHGLTMALRKTWDIEVTNNTIL